VNKKHFFYVVLKKGKIFKKGFRMLAYKGLFNVGQTFCGIYKQVIKSNANICMSMNIILLYKRQLMHKSHK
jgi:hypothetical protein